MSSLTRLSSLKKLMKPRLAQRAAGRVENQNGKQKADVDEGALCVGGEVGIMKYQHNSKHIL